MLESVFKVTELLNKVNSDFQVRSPGVHELKCLEQGPSVLAHKVGGKNTRSSALTPHRVDQHALSLFCSHIDEVKDLIGNPILDVKKNLVFVILPVERQVHDTYVFPKVLDLSPRAVDYVRDLVCNDELQILV